MNNYPEWWDDTITIFNKYVNQETKEVTWYATVLEGCYYSHEVEKLNLGQTTVSSNVSICRIRVNDSFVNKRAWNELQESDKRKFFTVSTGDIIVAEAVDDEINEYEKGKRSSDLITKYKEWPGCFIVETAKINVGGGRGNEHYHARGNG